MIKESNLEAFPYECEPLNTVPSESLPDMAPVRVDRQHDRQQDFLHSHHHARSAGYISLFEAMGIVAGTDRTISLSTRSMT